jgi:hypothetical protein
MRDVPQQILGATCRIYLLLLALAIAALAACVAGANAGAIELTDKNFDAEVFGSGKAAFIKFLAPW